MQLSVKGKQVDVGEALRSHIENTLPDSIGKYFDNATDVTVTISKDGHNFAVDIHTHVSKRVLVQGHGEAGDAYAAFEIAADHMLKRLRRHKRRLRDHRQKLSTADALPALQYILEAEKGATDDHVEEAPAAEPMIVAEMPTEVESMSVGEATMRLDLGGLPALLFRNSKHGGLNMVYQRADGNYGWVDPELLTAQAASGE
jgi:ribosomal subunit interface protein